MSTKIYRLFLVGALALLAATRFLPALKAPLSTFGYDFGFYLYAISHANRLNSFTLYGFALGGYGNPLFFIFYHLHLPPEATLHVLMALLTLACGLVLYRLFDNKQYGLWAIILFALSIPQALIYHMFLLKNMIGLLLLLITLLVVMKKHYWWLLLTMPLILFFHRTTTIISLLVIGLWAGFALIKNKNYKLLMVTGLCLIAAIIVAYPWLQTIAQTFLAHPNGFVKEGILLPPNQLLMTMLPYLLLGAVGAYSYLQNKQHSIILILFFSTSLWIALGLPFYNRVVLYADLSLIILAAYGLANMSWKKSILPAVSIIALGLICYNAVMYQIDKTPLIEATGLQEIQDTSKAHPKAMILALDASSAPWLLGYTEGVRLAAPGLFEDRHSFTDWEKFWNGENQIEFLSSYPKPLLIYGKNTRIEEETNKCLKHISQNFYSFECPESK